MEALQFLDDPAVQQDFSGLFNLLNGARENIRINSRGLVDQLVVDLLVNWLETNDQCGVVQDLADMALYNLSGQNIKDIVPIAEGVSAPRSSTLQEDNSDAKIDVYGENSLGGDQVEDFDWEEEEDDDDNVTVQNSTQNLGDRSLQMFTEQKCTSFESTIFLGSMLSFSNCAEVDIGRFFGTVEENIVNVGLRCLNTFLQPFQASNTCASENFQGYVVDECVKGIVNDNILGHIFKLFLVSPKQTCGCMSSLESIPQCRMDITEEVSLDGQMSSKIACLLESQVCNKLEEECDRRLGVLNECLPNLYDLNNENFDCEEVMCTCERNDDGLLNYPGRAMELPMSDMCQDHALDYFVGDFIVERYAVFQAKCDAEFLKEPISPSQSPTIAPTLRPNSDAENLSSLVRQNVASSLNSVVSGILIALAIAGVASILIVCILIVWRRRSSNGSKVQVTPEMSEHAHERMKRMEEDLRRMEEQNYKGRRL